MAAATSTIIARRLADFAKPRSRPVSASSSVFVLRRGGHCSATTYEKNPEEELCPTVVPDHVIHPGASQNYWAPHPQTGVFGPPAHHTDSASASASTSASKEGSVLELQAWFRHTALEDLDKDTPHFL